MRNISIDTFKSAMQHEFEIRDLGLIKCFFGHVEVDCLINIFLYVKKSMPMMGWRGPRW